MRKATRLLVACVGGALTIIAAPQVRASDGVLFSCATKSGKVIELKDSGKTIDYSYGKPGQPEIALRVPRENASTHQWDGMGSTESYEVDVPNGDTVYTVYSSIDKNEQSATAGVLVTVKGRQLADVRCADTANRVDHLEGVSLKARDD